IHIVTCYSSVRNLHAGQYPATTASITMVNCMRASTRSLPPGGGWKSDRPVSSRADVQLPEPSRLGVMRKLPFPSRALLDRLLVIVSTSPVPKLPGPPGYEVPVVCCQFPLGDEPAGPSKSSLNMRFQPGGFGG